MDKTLDLDELEQRIKDWAAGMVGFAYPMAIDEALRLISAARVVHWCADVQEVFMEDMEPAYFGFDDPPLLGDFTAAIGKPIIVSAARPAVVSDEVVSTLTKAFWAEYAKSDRGTTAMRAALALLPGGVPDREAIARVICPSAFEPATPGHSVVWYQAPLAEAEELALVKADAIIAMLSASPKGSSRSLPSRTAQEPPSPTPCDLEVTDRASQWMLENSEGRWLHNAEDGTFTSDPNLGLKWPNRTAADAFRLGLRGPLWALKLTEHVWIEPKPYDWTDAEDDIADVISDSMDMDWSSRDGARAVVAYLKQIGAKLP